MRTEYSFKAGDSQFHFADFFLLNDSVSLKSFKPYKVVEELILYPFLEL